MNICILAAGAGGMYCGSCLRDNVLAAALKRAGHQVTLVPLYTPLRTQEGSVSIHEVFFGGVNVYLQHAMRLFRHTPRVLDWILDRRWVLKLAGKYGADTPPAKLGPLTLTILEAERGPAVKELRRLLRFVAREIRPDVVSLPNLMFVGLARLMRQELNCPIVCELTGEDLFLDNLIEPYKSHARDLIRERSADVSRFAATSQAYAVQMRQYLGQAAGDNRIDVVYPGLSSEYLASLPAHDESPPSPEGRPPTVGYLARMSPEKGLERLLDAMFMLWQMPNMEHVHLRAAGYVSPANRKWVDSLKRRVARAGKTGQVRFLGEVDASQKIELLQSIDIFSVPTVYREAKGMYVLEALAAGVPVVLPSHGSFPELVDLTRGGVLTTPGDAQGLAWAMADLLADAPWRQALGRAGRAAVRAEFSDTQMAARMLDVYRNAMAAASNAPVMPAAVPTSAVDGHGVADVAQSMALQVNDLRKEYPTPAEPLAVLRGVSLQLLPGQTMAIIGPSGSGKSTLLNIIGTLDRPTAGTVRLAGIDPFALSDEKLAAFRSERIGFVFQDHHLLPQCTALENVLLPRLAQRPVTKEDTDRAADLLRGVGLAARMTHLPAEMSGGEKQRVAIARAMMNSPLLLLCDEPTGNLDSAAARSVGQLLHDVASQTHCMLIAVTHSQSLAAMFERRLRMTDGRLQEEP